MRAEIVLKRWQRNAFRTRDLNFVRALFAGYPKAKVYLVGGMVRDLLLNRETKDYDFVVTNVPEAKLLAFLKKHGRVNLVGKTFGVFKFVPKGKHGSEAIDIALPRLDLPGKGTGAYKDVKVVSKANLPIEEDLLRRDFTVNALAWCLNNQTLIDPSGGLVDLKKKTLRTVGEPEKRFKEDYSRLLRGLRFNVELKFSFEAKTWRSLKKLTAKLNDTVRQEFVVPREVIAKELLKTFYADPVAALKLYDESGAIKILLPELLLMKKCPQPRRYHTEGSVWKHTELALAALYSAAFRRRHSEEPNAELIIAVLLHDAAKPVMLRTPAKDNVDRVRFDGHDVVGGKMARVIAERLKLASMPAESVLHVDPANLEWLIAKHLLLLHARPRDMKLTTIERYFITHPLGASLKALMLADTLGTIPRSGRPYVLHLNELEKVVQKMAGARSRKLPPPLLNGDEIMELLSISGGPTIGFLKRKLREEQLLGTVATKQQAKSFLRRIYGQTNI
ncbi:MAG: hypothetical protein WC817_01270 [Patescibacteria group bacterium]|jgi:tRNA nucleotidyltransferase/poly(A) polymerase